MFKVSPASLQTYIDTPNCVFFKTVFSIARCTFRMYSVMAIFKSSTVWGLLEYTELFISPRRKKIGRKKYQRSWRPNGCRNDSVHKHDVQECHSHLHCMSRSVILVNLIFFQLRIEGVHNSHITVGS
jgi:hypothetical protein